MMVMIFECKKCEYKANSRGYRKYEIRDGEKVYLGHPGDGFAHNAIEEHPYIHKETHVIKWFEENEEISDEYIFHCPELLYRALKMESEEEKERYVPFCPDCKEELKLSGFLGCI